MKQSISRMNNLKVREITVAEHMLVADYWSNASDSYLLALGVDKSKMPARKAWIEALAAQCAQSLSRRHNFYLGWERDGDLVGHSNVSPFEYGKSGMIHMHVWDEANRGQGIAKICLAETMKMFFDILKLEMIVCEPYKQNRGPNKTLQSLGFRSVKCYWTTPGPFNLKQEVNRYEIFKHG